METIIIRYNKTTAIAVVIANMIGTGVFTSLGFQVLGLPDAFTIMMLWLTGGVIALCGAFCYAEIATRLKESGGEYLYLSKIFHPALGFTSAWISLFAGFAGAIAASALALGKYASPLFGYAVEQDPHAFFTPQKIVGISALVLLSLVHIQGVKAGGLVQTILTGLKVSLIAFFCLAPFFVDGSFTGVSSFAPTAGSSELIFSTAFAGSLAWVMFAYSGWNSAAYIAGNVENPRKTLPFALITGTLLVALIYLALNAMFLATTPMGTMAGNEDIGNIVALKIFGADFGMVFSGLFSLALLSTCSSMIIAGPRVLEKVGKDYTFFKVLTQNSKGGTPTIAILVQGTISAILIMVSSFKDMIEYISIVLTFFSTLTVIGLMVLRARDKNPGENIFKTPLYPLPAILFICAAVWMVTYFAKEDPRKLIYGLLSMVPGLIIYLLTSRTKTTNN
jgi:APA family basic amino acid/polyamine antiporter